MTHVWFCNDLNLRPSPNRFISEWKATRARVVLNNLQDRSAGIMVKRFRVNKQFVPCPVIEGDELYSNGIFEFNITKIIEYIDKNPADIGLETVMVEDYYKGFSSLDEAHVDKVAVSRPVIIAEIFPMRYNLIDGHHRMEKARRIGLRSLPAFKLNAVQHMKFMTSSRSHAAYIEYWNDKLKGMIERGGNGEYR